jgi:hypothetical protein
MNRATAMPPAATDMTVRSQGWFAADMLIQGF